METLWVDFNNAGEDGIRLICKGTLDDLAIKGIQLEDAMRFMLWQEDEDLEGNQDNLMVEGTVKYGLIDQ